MTPIPSSLDALIGVFDSAAAYIDKYGWWASTITVPESEVHATKNAACISNAISYVADGGRELTIVKAAQDTLVNHFGVDTIGEVFMLNDSQPEDIGKEWAISNLREIADKLRANKREGAAV